MSKRPAIGFIGYAGDWQKSSFADDMISFHTGTGKLGTETNTGIPLIKMGNLQRGYFDFEKEEFLAEGETVSSESMVNFGDFLFNTRNTLELVGKGATWAGKSGMFAFNNNIAKLNLRNVDTMFFNYLYNTEKLLAQVHATAMGTTSVAAIYPRSLGTIQYYIPEPEEQKRISALFRKLDELLFVQQRKYDKLLTYKKAMMEKLFPKDGADVPEVRFAGFVGKWERCEFEEFFDLLSNNTLSRAELSYEQGKVCNVHYGDILVKFGEMIDLAVDRLPFIADVANISKNSFLQEGDIIIADTAEDSTVGKCSEITGISDINAVSGLHTIPCRPKRQFAKGYLGYFMNSPTYHDQLLPLMQGTKVTSVSKSALQHTVLMYPVDIAEQTQIGCYFITLERLIVLQKRKVDGLKKVKSALLNKMFI